jgi:hypothetical protein
LGLPAGALRGRNPICAQFANKIVTAKAKKAQKGREKRGFILKKVIRLIHRGG